MIAAFIVLAVVVLVVSYVRNPVRLLRERMIKTERRQIAAVSEGAAARVVGAVRPGETLTAPLSGRTCVLYEAIVEEQRSNGKTSHWHQVIREVRGVPFAIEDGSGHALVDPTHAQLLIEKDSTSRSGSFDDATEVEASFLARHGISSKGWFFNKAMRYREGVLEVGETVAVVGLAVREPDPDGAARMSGYREGPPTRLRLSGSAQAPLAISDVDSVKG